MTRVQPIQAAHSDGLVCAWMDPTTAQQLADAWELAHVLGELDGAERPTWLVDVVELRRAADHAAVQAGTARPVRLVTKGGVSA